MTMPRGAAVVYPKDAAQILRRRRHLPRRPGDRGRCRLGRADAVAAAGRRADRPAHLVRAPRGLRRHRPAERGELLRPVRTRPGICGSATWWRALPATRPGVDRVILDMLAPWECVDAAGRGAGARAACCARYVATTTQLARTGRDAPGAHAASPNRRRPSRWSAPGTPKGWPCGPGTTWSATPGSWSSLGGWRPASSHRPANAVQRPARMARITPVRVPSRR